MSHHLIVDIISQEKHLLTKEAIKLIAPGIQGEVTILPHHIPLFTRLKDGIVTIVSEKDAEEFAILGGFMDVNPESHITILADAAFSASDINEAEALKAKKRAEEVMKQHVDEVEFRQAEASLRKAILELKISRRKKSSRIPGSSDF